MKIFSKEAKIGLVGIIAIVILWYGINFLKGVNMFTTQNRYYVEFEDVSQLTESSPVYADGYNIGIVSSIIYNYNNPGHVVVVIDVDPSAKIGEGSSAYIDATLMGSTSMHLSLARNPEQFIAPGDTLFGASANGLMAKANELMPTVEKLLPKLDSILAGINILVNDPSLTGTLHNAEAATANLKIMTAKLNRFMGTLPQLTNNLNKTCENVQTLTTDIDTKINEMDVETTLKNVNSTLAEVQALTDKLNSKEGSVGLLLNDPELYNNLNLTMSNAAALLENVKGHPKRYVHFSLFGKKDK